MPDVMLDETAEGNLFAALRMREADLEKHLQSGQGAEQKDEAREKAREEARKKLEEDRAEGGDAEAAAGVRQPRGLPARAGAEPPQGQDRDGRARRRSNARPRPRRRTDRAARPSARTSRAFQAPDCPCAARAMLHCRPRTRRRWPDDATAALLAPHPARRRRHRGPAAPAGLARAGDRRRRPRLAGRALPGTRRRRPHHARRRRQRRPHQPAAPDRARPWRGSASRRRARRRARSARINPEMRGRRAARARRRGAAGGAGRRGRRGRRLQRQLRHPPCHQRGLRRACASRWSRAPRSASTARSRSSTPATGVARATPACSRPTRRSRSALRDDGRVRAAGRHHRQHAGGRGAQAAGRRRHIAGGPPADARCENDGMDRNRPPRWPARSAAGELPRRAAKNTPEILRGANGPACRLGETSLRRDVRRLDDRGPARDSSARKGAKRSGPRASTRKPCERARSSISGVAMMRDHLRAELRDDPRPACRPAPSSRSSSR